MKIILRNIVLLITYLSLTLSLLVNILVFFKPDDPFYLKERILQLDASIFGGFFRLKIHPSPIPTNLAQLSKPPEEDYKWLNNGKEVIPIAHATGPIFYGGSNSIDTFKKGYELGFRLFEVDLIYTTDNQLICYHGESKKEVNQINYATYIQKIESQNIKPCKFYDIISAIKTYPDVYIILDVKNRFSESYQKIRAEIQDPVLGKRFIPQIYHFDQLEDFRNRPFFAGEIFTSYLSGLPTEKIFQLAKESGIRVVTLTLPRAILLKKMPPFLNVFTHPVDDPNLANYLINKGIKGIYTFHLSPIITPRLYHK